MQVTVVAPVNQPRQGYVVYYDTRRAAARPPARQDARPPASRRRSRPRRRRRGRPGRGAARRDRTSSSPDEIIVSTHPAAEVRLAAPQRGRADAARRRRAPVRARRRRPRRASSGPANVLVVANETVLGDDAARAHPRARSSRARPASSSSRRRATAGGTYDDADKRLLRAVPRLRSEGLDVHGQISHPDPYTAVMQAIHDERVDEIIVSTLPACTLGLAAPRPRRPAPRPTRSCRSSTSGRRSPSEVTA